MLLIIRQTVDCSQKMQEQEHRAPVPGPCLGNGWCPGWRRLFGVALIWGLGLACLPAASAEPLADVIQGVQPKMVKVYGAGGLRRLEAYQSGFLVSAEGHIVTAWSYVLDSDVVTVILSDGRRYPAELLGADPRIELAVLKIEATELPHFRLDDAVELPDGSRVLAFSNLFGVATGNEPVSVQLGTVAIGTSLAARRSAFEIPYRGPVYVLDAVTNNPGAAGGALTDSNGRLAAVLGKELRNASNDTWLNYALPISAIRPSLDDLLAGRSRPRRDETARKPREPVSLAQLGIVLTPDVLHRTPPFIDRIAAGSPAAKAGLQPDDLILFVNRRTVPSCKLLVDELSYIDRIDEVRLTVQRQDELIDVVLQADK